MKSTGKKVTLLVAVISVAVLVVAGIFLEQHIHEHWLILKLESDDEIEKYHAVNKLVQMRSKRAETKFLEFLRNGDVMEKATAVNALGDMRSVEGTPALIHVLRQEAPEPSPLGMSNTGLSIYDFVKKAIVKIGKPTVPGLVELLGDPEWFVRLAAAEVLGEIGPEASEAGPALTELMMEDDPSVPQCVQEVATEALKKVQGQ